MVQPNASHAPRLTETRARQASWGRPVFWVLVISIILSGAALFAVWAYNAPGLTAVEPTRERLPPEGHSPITAPTPPKPPTPRDL